jgi:hypothetical protein
MSCKYPKLLFKSKESRKFFIKVLPTMLCYCNNSRMAKPISVIPNPDFLSEACPPGRKSLALHKTNKCHSEMNEVIEESLTLNKIPKAVTHSLPAVPKASLWDRQVILQSGMYRSKRAALPLL